jgi:putative tryptophan/tyrosine transport system substrate-binding protein
VRRRRLVIGASAAAALPARPLRAQPSPQRPALLAGVFVAGEKAVRPYQDALVEGLRDRGLVPGRHLALEIRYSDGDANRLAALVDEVIALEPRVLFGLESVAVVMRRRTTTIPIVLTSSADPVAAGLVQSLRRPGTNVTGMASLLVELVAKQVELLTQVVPGLSRVALLGDARAPVAARYEASAREAAAVKGLTLGVASVDGEAGLAQAFAALERQRSQALVVATTGAMNHMRQQVAAHARRMRLPSISALPAESWVADGGLIAYAPNMAESFRSAASHIKRILEGADPADLPVEQATRFQFIVNLKTARDIGLVIPQSVLLRADAVVE